MSVEAIVLATVAILATTTITTFAYKFGGGGGGGSDNCKLVLKSMITTKQNDGVSDIAFNARTNCVTITSNNGCAIYGAIIDDDDNDDDDDHSPVVQYVFDARNVEESKTVCVCDNIMILGTPDTNEVRVLYNRRASVDEKWNILQTVNHSSIQGFGNVIHLSNEGTRLLIQGYNGWQLMQRTGLGEYLSILTQTTTDAERRRIVSALDPCGQYFVIVVGMEVRVYHGLEIIRIMQIYGVQKVFIFVPWLILTVDNEIIIYHINEWTKARQRIPNNVNGFGRSIVKYEQYLLIGSPFEDRVYVYKEPYFTYVTYVESDYENSEFGHMVKTSDKYVIIMAPGYGDDENGAVFIYEFLNTIV
jgi:hypothetical protein